MRAADTSGTMLDDNPPSSINPDVELRDMSLGNHTATSRILRKLDMRILPVLIVVRFSRMKSKLMTSSIFFSYTLWLI